jgi:polysaccharide deacetylase family protein (PEP-CTERM system associated)
MKSFLLTIDVEDWFQVENFKPWIPFSSWPACELRVERNVHRLLDLFDSIRSEEAGGRRQEVGGKRQEARGKRQEIGERSIELPQAKRPSSPARSGTLLQPPTDQSSSPQTKCSSSEAILEPPPPIRATFFILGWIAERLPHLVREIHARGHEVASHGYCHSLCCDQTCEDLTGDLRDSKKLLEDTIGSEIFGYRAPSFSINDDILKIIAECGYLYDSSYNSFSMHGRYGKISLNGHERRGIGYKVFDGFYELPISNLPLWPFLTLAHFRHFFLPWGGGAYFRLMPFFMFKQGVKRILAQKGGYAFYMHPWEIDAEQPRVKRASRFSRFRHHTNVRRTERRLAKLISQFNQCSFLTCNQYLDSDGPLGSERHRRVY